MRFRQIAIPVAYPDAAAYFACMQRVKEHWRSLGWNEVPKADEPAIQASWSRHLQPGRDLQVPKPSRRWNRVQLNRLGAGADEIEADFTLKVLAAFRRCTASGERLLAIDWQHAWYTLNPHADICAPTLEEWAMPILPDADCCHFVAPDFRFGVVTGLEDGGYVEIFGASLLAAFDQDPPESFLRACGPGVISP